jgi:hypothetical protein
VAIDARGCSPRRLCAGYQVFGLLCTEGKVRAALVRTDNEDPEGHYALGDILVTLGRVAGVALQFRLAFVARSEAMVEVCRRLQKRLAPLGCELQVFPVPSQARQWLDGELAPALIPPGSRARAAVARAQAG